MILCPVFFLLHKQGDICGKAQVRQIRLKIAEQGLVVFLFFFGTFFFSSSVGPGRIVTAALTLLE